MVASAVERGVEGAPGPGLGERLRCADRDGVTGLLSVVGTAAGKRARAGLLKVSS